MLEDVSMMMYVQNLVPKAILSLLFDFVGIVHFHMVLCIFIKVS